MYEWTADYIVQDSFLDEEDYNWCVGFFDNLSNKNKDWQISKNKIYYNGRQDIQDEYIYTMHKKYNPLLLTYLKRLAPDKIKDYTYSEFNFVKNGPEHVFKIHNDTPNKLLSVVIYIQPNKNTGTLLYSNQQGDDEYEVVWKCNRALIFSRNNETWHSYRSDGKTERCCLVYNLRSP